MSIVNQISKDGVIHDIGAIYDDLDQKISETYATIENLNALDTKIKGLEDRIAALEATSASNELDA